MNPWFSLETIPTQSAVRMVWRRRLQNDFEAFRDAFLQPEPEPVTYYPCPYGPGCPHDIVHHADGSMGFWELTFAGKHAVLKHEQGLYYVAYLLLNPPDEPIHGLALALRADPACSISQPANEILDPASARPIVVQRDATIQERDLRLDDADAACRLRRTRRQLQALVDNPNECEMAKAEARQQIQHIEDFLCQDLRRIEDDSQKAVRAVRRAITRFHQRLATTLDAHGQPQPVLSSFAAHLQKYLLIPSARFSARPDTQARIGLAGRFSALCALCVRHLRSLCMPCDRADKVCHALT